MLDGIVFDLDGVLLLSSVIHESAYRQALSDYPIQSFEYSRFAGMRTLECLQILLAENGIAVTSDELLRLAHTKSRLAAERLRQENPLAPGCISVLTELSARYRIALASSASERAVNEFVDRNRLRPMFGCVLHGSSVKQAKPSPELPLAACSLLQTAPGRTLVVEDSVAGIAAAKSAGTLVCGIPTTLPAPALRRAGADLVVDRLEELVNVV